AGKTCESSPPVTTPLAPEPQQVRCADRRDVDVRLRKIVQLGACGAPELIDTESTRLARLRVAVALMLAASSILDVAAPVALERADDDHGGDEFPITPSRPRDRGLDATEPLRPRFLALAFGAGHRHTREP